MSTGDAMLAARALEVIEPKLARREAQIISEVTAKAASGEPLDPQYAIQKWLALTAIRQLRKGLEQDGRAEQKTSGA